MASSLPTTGRRFGDVAGELGDLALDLGLDVKRWLAASGPASVAGDDQVTDLGPQLVVDLGSGQPRQLELDVYLGLTAPPAPGVSRLEQLTDLHVALGGRRGPVRVRWLRVQQQMVLAV